LSFWTVGGVVLTGVTAGNVVGALVDSTTATIWSSSSG
jgi:hypothetical protein